MRFMLLCDPLFFPYRHPSLRLFGNRTHLTQSQFLPTGMRISPSAAKDACFIPSRLSENVKVPGISRSRCFTHAHPKGRAREIFPNSRDPQRQQLEYPQTGISYGKKTKKRHRASECRPPSEGREPRQYGVSPDSRVDCRPAFESCGPTGEGSAQARRHARKRSFTARCVSLPH